MSLFVCLLWHLVAPLEQGCVCLFAVTFGGTSGAGMCLFGVAFGGTSGAGTFRNPPEASHCQKCQEPHRAGDRDSMEQFVPPHLALSSPPG